MNKYRVHVYYERDNKVYGSVVVEAKNRKEAEEEASILPIEDFDWYDDESMALPKIEVDMVELEEEDA